MPWAAAIASSSAVSVFSTLSRVKPASAAIPVPAKRSISPRVRPFASSPAKSCNPSDRAGLFVFRFFARLHPTHTHMQDEPQPIPIDLGEAKPAPWFPAPRLVWPAEPRPVRSLILALGLFAVTALSTLAAGAQFAAAYAANQAPGFESFFSDYFRPFVEPRLLISGIPFALTLLGILLAHELGHFFACRHYHISATYPYFIPAPTLIGTLGAFIRIRSPIFNRRALFDMALAGPLVGFSIAVPALALAILFSKVTPPSLASPLIFGQPLIER